MFGKFIALVIIVSAVCLISGCSSSKKSPLPIIQQPLTDSPKINVIAPESARPSMSVLYYSDSGEELEVIYHIDESSVTVIQPNGKQTTLPQAMAASGIRYTKNEKTVFWSKGPTAQFYIDDKLVFKGAEKE